MTNSFTGSFVRGPGGTLVLAANGRIRDFSRTGVLTVGTGTRRLYWPTAARIKAVTASLGAVAYGDVVLDVNLNGTTIFTNQANRPTVPSGAYVGARAIPNVDTLAAGDYLTVDRDVIGATPPVTYVNSVATATATTGALSMPSPSGTITGDLLIYAVTMVLGTTDETPTPGTPAAVITPPGDATLIAGPVRSPHNLAGPDMEVSYYSRIDDGTTPSFGTDLSSGFARRGAVAAFRGANPTAPIAAHGALTGNSFVTTHTLPAVTAPSTDNLLVYFDYLGAAMTMDTPPSGMTGQTTTSLRYGLATQQLSAQGSTGTKTATYSATNYGVGLLLALATDPAAALPGQDLGLVVEYEIV